jgi:hypothetical protein
MNLSKIAFILSLSFHLFVVWFFLNHFTAPQNHAASTSTAESGMRAYIVPAASSQVPALPIMPALTQDATAQSADSDPALKKSRPTTTPLASENAALGVESTAIDASAASRTMLGEIYYYADALEKTAEELISPEFDFSQLPSDLQGHVKLEIFVNKFGLVVDVRVLSSEPTLKLSDAVVAGFRKLVYFPAIRAGNNVASIKMIEMTILEEVNPVQAPMQLK